MKMADPNDYVVGRGRLFFGQFKAGTRRASGERYFGNTPALSLSQDEDTLDHYNSDAGLRVKDASVTLQSDSSGSFQCDNISSENLALWFRGQLIKRIEAGSTSASGTLTISTAPPVANDKFTVNGNDITFVAANPVGMQVLIAGTLAATAVNLANFINDTPALGVSATAAAGVVTLKSLYPGEAGNAVTLAKTFTTAANGTVSGATLTGGADVTETITDVARGMWYQLGITDATPQGVRGVGGVTITGVDEDSYVVEPGTGRFFIKSDAADIVDGSTIEVGYGVSPVVEDVVIARGETIEGKMTFIANNATGSNRDYHWPYVKLTPDGDFALKGDDWQAMTFNFEILLRDEATERQYITKRAASVVAGV
jgi:hypothetical protein